MSIELTECPCCKRFVALRSYDFHIMRCEQELSRAGNTTEGRAVTQGPSETLHPLRDALLYPQERRGSDV